MRHVYIGYDPREEAAYLAAEDSLRQVSGEVSVTPIKLTDPAISSILTRPIERIDGKMWCPISQAPMSVEFAISRFCVPFLHKEGWCLFTDCDMMFLKDIEKLFSLADDRYAVMVVKHDYKPTSSSKMDGQIQTVYPRKLWSSVILWNCSHPANQALTLDKLNTWPGRDLHAFKWLPDELIGGLPKEWNYLVEIDHDEIDPGILHFTLGGPWMRTVENDHWHELWKSRYKELIYG